ncbi:MAG: hypothetical protein ACK5XN_01020 [Bacteroidota bacterium]
MAGPFPIDQQLRYARAIAEKVGYDFNRGRLDTAPHPFEIRLHHGDIRITTRARENELGGECGLQAEVVVLPKGARAADLVFP